MEGNAKSSAGIRLPCGELEAVILQGAIFDCDGLLADTETPDYEAWRQIYEEQGLHLPIAHWAQNIGVAKGHDLADWHAPLAERVGPGYDRDATQTRRHAHYQAAIAALTPMPGITELLDALAWAGIPCAVASNSERAWVDNVLAVSGLANRFAAIATADEVPNAKPAPDVYLLAASRLGVPPEACVAFEDSPRGLAAAHAAGMFTVAVPTVLTNHFDFVQAHHRTSSLEGMTPNRLNALMEYAYRSKD